MDKTEWHNWGRYIMLGVLIIFACGGWVTKVISNTVDIADVAEEVEDNKDNIHVLQIQTNKIESVVQNINGSLVRLESGQTNFHIEMRGQLKEQRIAQQAMFKEVTETSIKVKQLTKE